MKASENFTIKELCTSQTAKRNGFEEQFTPPLSVIENLTIGATKILEPIRDKFGAFSVSQGYRCDRLNSAVGGAKNSEHTKGLAFDIDLGSRNKDLFEFCKTLKFRQLISEFPENGVPDWVHISFDPFDLKGEILEAYKDSKNVTKYKKL